MKLFLIGLMVLAIFIGGSLLMQTKVTTPTRGFATTAILIVVNLVMVWGVVRKHD